MSINQGLQQFFEQAGFLVEFVNQGVHLVQVAVDIAPIGPIIPLGLDFPVGFALLLDPGERFQVVDAFAVIVASLFHVVDGCAQQVAVIRSGGVQVGKLAPLFV